MLAASVLPDNDVAPAALVCRALHLHALSEFALLRTS